jgi:predicted transcriptional regulator
MAINDILNFYEEVKDDLKFQNTSSVRTKIMICLSGGSKKSKDLKKLTEMQTSTILHGINELEKQNLVIREGDRFFLSEIGKIMTLKLMDIIKTSVSLKKFQRLWLDHEIDDIPPEFLMDIGDLSNSKLVETDNIDIFKPHGAYMDILLQSKEIKGVSPIYYPDYTETFKNLIDNDIKVEIVLTDSILKKTINSLDQGQKDLKKLISTGNLTIWKLNRDTKVAFTITDKFAVMGLFFIKGTYDSNRLLISNHNDAITWNNKLFEYYRQESDIFEL